MANGGRSRATASALAPSVPLVPLTTAAEAVTTPSSDCAPALAPGVPLVPLTTAAEAVTTPSCHPVALPRGQWELHAHGRIHPTNPTTRLPAHVRLLLWRGTHHLFQGPTWRSYEALAAADTDAQECIVAMDDITADGDGDRKCGKEMTGEKCHGLEKQILIPYGETTPVHLQKAIDESTVQKGCVQM